MKEIEWSEAPIDELLWCVYGPDSFPTVFACKIKNHPTEGRVIWGFSVYRRQKGFRTLGQGVSWYLDRDAKLFSSKAEAFAYIASLFP